MHFRIFERRAVTSPTTLVCKGRHCHWDYGPNCEHIDGCQIHFCHNNATCRNVTESGDVSCSCVGGFAGKFCTDYNPCLLTPCENGGICINMTHHFYGEHCQNIHFCQLHEKCQNGATCTILDGMMSREVLLNIGLINVIRANVSNRYTCLCPPGFSGKWALS